MITMMRSRFADATLANRLERAEGSANAAMVRTRATLDPGCGAFCVEIAGALLQFDGVGSPITQTFGLGLRHLPTDDELTAIEAFFINRGAPVAHETCPLADPALPGVLAARGYRPVEQSNVLYRLIDPAAAPFTSASVSARVIAADEADLWSEVAAAGWAAEAPALGEFMQGFGRILTRCPSAVCFLAELEGWPIAAAAMFMHDGVAILAGSSTVPQRRRLGAQAALLAARLGHAADADCDLAMVVTTPGSASQRNAERSGFRVAWTRTKWQLGPLS